MRLRRVTIRDLMLTIAGVAILPIIVRATQPTPVTTRHYAVAAAVACSWFNDTPKGTVDNSPW